VKRWLAVYALAFFAFLHLPLLTLAVFSFKFLTIHYLGGLLLRLVSCHLP
jgi:ABC-type spermidine/putrescine transport system permease subunit II